ncbi:MAG: hypothetical protein J6U23_05655 [Clostridiales bacterium]|nr:hypothetical protein [Clostridiales bacterium]
MATSKAVKKAVRKYDEENTVQFNIKLNKNTDSDILEILEAVTNKQGFIKELIRVNMGNLDEYGIFSKFAK